jgi:hypothetical protein
MNCFRNLSVAVGLPVRRGFAAAAKSKKLTKLTQKLGFVGGGRMAESIIRGLLAKELVDPKDIMMSDPEPERRALMESLGIVTTDVSSRLPL